MDFFGLQKLTLLDYPGHIACTAFTGGCNFRCPYCHNGGLVLKSGTSPRLSEDDILDFLRKRIGKLEGITISGGEPTIHAGLPDFLAKVKSLGFAVKLDTNGYNCEMLAKLMDRKLVDYVAMDIKNSPGRYEETTCVPISVDEIKRSVQLLMNGRIPYEFRTTLCKELHDEAAVSEIGMWLKGCRAYYLQPYRDAPEVLRPGIFHAPSRQMLDTFLTILRPNIPDVFLRES